ncbi:hypothetical protein [Yinghuangia seranimata]|uniref:hypothetical protein n=1 Tax=Yinghuangia seranimata TaxID=408067 RepID=UPI00248BBB66|nr:hypothetical protein [Yinghuangia seranimata]MDI2127127.1 hypothetical protein [Yinghuangia seranimata]
MTGVPHPEPPVPTPVPAAGPAPTEREPLGTRMVRARLGVTTPYALTVRHRGDDVLAPLAGLVADTASRLDFFDDQAVRAVTHVTARAAAAGRDPDAHLCLSGAWSSVAAEARGIEVDQARISELTQTLNAALTTYTRVLAVAPAS